MWRFNHEVFACLIVFYGCQFPDVWLAVYVYVELRKEEECKSEEAWQEGEESNSELDDEEEHRQNSEAEEEEEEDEEQEEGKHMQDGTQDHIPVFTLACVKASSHLKENQLTTNFY